MNKLLMPVFLIVFCTAGLFGCGRRESAYAEESTPTPVATVSEPTPQPLYLDDPDEATNSVVYASIGGILLKYEYDRANKYDNRANDDEDTFSYYISYDRYDTDGGWMSSIRITIPKSAKSGDVYRYNDECEEEERDCGIEYDYIDITGTFYCFWARNTGWLTEYWKDNGYLDGVYGNKYVIVIDHVSDDGMVIEGRLMAEFFQTVYAPDDECYFKIDESTFVFDRSDRNTVS